MKCNFKSGRGVGEDISTSMGVVWVRLSGGLEEGLV